MKKFLMSIAFAMMLMFSNNASTEAKDVWVYTDAASGEYYVMDDTFRKEMRGGYACGVQVKYIDVITGNRIVVVLDYIFSVDQEGVWCWKNGKPREMKAPEWAIWNYAKTRRHELW